MIGSAPAPPQLAGASIWFGAMPTGKSDVENAPEYMKRYWRGEGSIIELEELHHSSLDRALSDLAEPLFAQLATVRELVVSVPAPRCDHRKHEEPALAKQVSFRRWIVHADLVGRMDEVELDRSAAARLEVDKQ
jgi:hypothetical protein